MAALSAASQAGHPPVMRASSDACASELRPALLSEMNDAGVGTGGTASRLGPARFHRNNRLLPAHSAGNPGKAARVAVLGNIGQERVEIFQERIGDAVVRPNLPAAFVLAQHHQAGLPSHQLGRGLENQRQDRGQVERLGEGARDLQQVVALADAKIR